MGRGQGGGGRTSGGGGSNILNKFSPTGKAGTESDVFKATDGTARLAISNGDISRDISSRLVGRKASPQEIADLAKAISGDRYGVVTTKNQLGRVFSRSIREITTDYINEVSNSTRTTIDYDTG